MISIELASEHIHIAQGSGGKNKASISRIVSLPMPDRIVKNGQIVGPEELAAILMEGLSENGFKGKTLDFMIDSTTVKTKRIEIPNDKREKMIELVKYELAKVTADEEHIVDYVVHNEYKAGGKKLADCVAFAVPRTLVKSCVDTCDVMKYKVNEINLLNDAIIKLLEMTDSSLKLKKEIKATQKNKVKNKKTKGMATSKDKEDEEIKAISKNAPLRLWVGLYYRKIKIFATNGKGEITVTTIMNQQSVSSENDSFAKEIAAFYIREIQKFIQMQSGLYSERNLESIEVFGENDYLSQICNVASDLFKVPVNLLKVPKGISGVTQSDFAKYAGVIGAIARRG
jgi:Tfp pilus assembly protein, ATPase PilM